MRVDSIHGLRAETMVDGLPCAFRFFPNRRQRSPDHDQDDFGHMTPSIDHNLLSTVRSGYPFVRTFVDLHARGNPSTMVPARKHWIRLARDHRCVDLQFSLHFVSKFCGTCSSNGPHLSAEQASRGLGGGARPQIQVLYAGQKVLNAAM